MLGDSAVLGGGGGGGGEGGSSVDAVAAVVAGGRTHEGGGGGVGSNSGDDERGGRIDEGERSFGGNRWPRQETLALLRIRSDMDGVFRDASVKGPLWEEVARKMAELGYHRSSKKCKEKFENVYKYHKRTKEGRGGKQDGKTYRFFDQLEALEHQYSPTPSKPPQPVVVTTTTTVSVPMPLVPNTTLSVPQVNSSTVPSTTVPAPTPTPLSLPIPNIPQAQSINLTIPASSFPPVPPPPTTTTNPTTSTIPISFPNIPTDLLSNSSSSSTSSDEIMEEGRRKRKRKWKDFFERLMKEVVEKQEEMQKRFLEAIEKREHDRMVREEAWRQQEMQRINREKEILAQERSIASAKDAAVMTFLHKIAEQQNLGHTLNNLNNNNNNDNVQQPQPQPSSVTLTPPVLATPPVLVQQQQQPPVTQPVLMPVILQPQPQPQIQLQQGTGMEIVKVADNNGENFMASASSSRWPKVEVEALIKLRTSLDAKYQENGPKGPLWEEISASMRKLGYNRSSKRCKEKWENINKYFKKVKESNKKRPQDSKTCPYFHQLDALYRERNKVVKPESMAAAPLMVRPEQQWPPQQNTTRDVTMEENDPMNKNHEDDQDDEDDYEDKDDGEDEDEDDEGGNYEIVASKPATASAE